MSARQPELALSPAVSPSPPSSAPLSSDRTEAEMPGVAPTAAMPSPRGSGLFGGRELLLLGLMAVLLLWAAWATRELLALKERRVVSVSLATMVQDFVASEARRGASQQDAAARTRAYLGAIDAAMRAISEDGTTILVSEAVLGNSVPDVTTTVMKAVNSRLGLAPSPAAPSAAAAPLAGLPPLPGPSAPNPEMSMPDAKAAADSAGATTNPLAEPVQ